MIRYKNFRTGDQEDSDRLPGLEGWDTDERGGGRIMKMKEFRLVDVVRRIETRKIPGKISDFPKQPSGPYTLPAIAAGSRNQGIACYVRPEDADILQSVISVAANGDGHAFYQSKPFTILQDAYAVEPIGHEPTEGVCLYLTGVIQKLLSQAFGWTNKSGWNKVKDYFVSLPATTVMVPDWTALEALLTAHAGGGVADMSKIDTSSWKKFKISDLFTSETGDVDLQQKDVNSGESNTGIIGNIDKPAKIISERTITIDMFGSVWYRDFSYKMVTHARVFALIPKKPINREIGLYLVSTLKKLTTEFSYNNMCSWNKIKDIEILLPAQIEDVPDWDLMERYIRAVEKIVIKDVVDFKDTFIAKAKEAITA